MPTKGQRSFGPSPLSAPACARAPGTTGWWRTRPPIPRRGHPVPAMRPAQFPRGRPPRTRTCKVRSARRSGLVAQRGPDGCGGTTGGGHWVAAVPVGTVGFAARRCFRGGLAGPAGCILPRRHQSSRRNVARPADPARGRAASAAGSACGGARPRTRGRRNGGRPRGGGGAQGSRGGWGGLRGRLDRG